ncbi:hypothetical protein B0H17DRAFT_1049498 [Mycena rosella]|uniref:F-box domain-containing protein n=1 Tax=Mycena rosella TaxID=1033263 RepID=A0AAD7DTH5_MYCRO|nr:hypothetical protein B0H17DRAFT_1049498 [Mycena rosella]
MVFISGLTYDEAFKMPHWLSLPVELWLHILSFQIRLRDLGELCLTCSQLLSITRPVLYHHLTLVAERHLHANLAVADTFALLADDHLARSVRELTLDSRSTSEAYYRNPGLVHVSSLRNMTQLKRVTIMGDISRHAGTETIAQFIKILHDLHLDELRFPVHGVRGFILAIKPAQLVQLANPKRIECNVGVDYNGLLASSFLTLLAAAPPSLTSLSLIAPKLYSDCPMHKFFALRFPHLRSLALVSTLDQGSSCPPGFTVFLSAHRTTLEDIHLGWNSVTPTSGPAALVLDDASALHPDFLPNLQTFRGDCRNVEMMARARMRCLSTLRDLAVGSAAQGDGATIADVRAMLGALEAAGHLPALRHLDFELFDWRTVERAFVPEFVRRLGALCGPTLEVWRGLLPFTAAWPMDAFAAFPRLRAIRLPQDSTSLRTVMALDQTYEATDVLQCLHSLARNCTELREVVVAARRRRDDVCWKIDRHSGLDIALRRVDLDWNPRLV